MTEEVVPTAPVVLFEHEISGGQLHALANSGGQTFGDGMFGVRFILKSSFKAPHSNFVVKKYVMQVITKGKGNTVQPDKVATVVKVEKATPVKGKPKAPKEKIEELKIEEKVEQKNAW